MERISTTRSKGLRTLAYAVLTAAMFVAGPIASAQDYQGHRGNTNRTGLPTLSLSTPPLSLPTTYNNPGRSFIRWWDPIQTARISLDTGDPGTLAFPAGNWSFPTSGTSPFAFNFLQNNTVNPAYAFTTTVPALDFNNQTVAAAGSTLATYSFTFSAVGAGQEYEVFLNVPVGPTDTDPTSGVSDPHFPQRYLVVQVSGVVGGPFTDIIDTFAEGGGLIQLGNNGAFTNNVFTVDAVGDIVVTVFNTAPRSPAGGFLDPLADPGNELVYADAALIVGQEGATGQYVASPVVGEIQAIAPSGAPEAYTRRVVSARNEDSFIGLLNRQVSVGVLSSFTHNGLDVFDPTFTGRKNLVWSWPFKRPFGNSTAEIDRAASDKQAWVTGPNAANSRAFQRIQVDNRNGSSTSSGLFVPDNTIIPHIGEDYMNAPGTFGGALSAVTWAPTLPEGGYTIQVWLPTASPSNNLATSAVYQVLSGGTVIDTIEVDQSAGNGWLTFSGQPADGYPNSAKAPLSFRVTDHVNKAADAGRTVYADAVRFVRNSDLSITSTPVQTRATMTLPGGATAVRDVIVAATEDGKIYCMDAHGDPTTGDPPQLYWVYPSADPATDPNHVQAEDGLDGMAEMPTGFDMSSALVENVGGVDLLYIGSKNGRVYCLEMGGRGDGTTRRRWTFPDDYNPTLPAAQIAPSALGQIVGSVAFGPGGGTPTIYVPTSQGRVYALDAAGDPVSKTTTVRWQFPDAASLPIGAVNMTPAVAFGNVYFGAGTSTSPTAGAFYAVDEATGTMVWQSLTTPSGPFVRFDRSSPVVVPGAQITGGGPFAGIDTVFFVDQSGRFVSLNAATGAFQWETSEIGSASIGSPIFTYQTVFNNASVLQADVPVVVVPSTSGRLVSLLADGSVNVAGRREVWGYTLDGDTLFASPASGGKNLVEAHSWLYVGDNKGTFYAFNHDPALPDTGQIIPPNGQVPPGNDESQDNDGASQLNSIIDPNAVVLLVPQAYDTLFEKLQDGTLTYTDITAAATTQFASRRDFEFGESLYLLAYNMPSAAGQFSNYFLDVEMSGGGRGASRRQFQVRTIPSGTPPAGDENFLLVALPILPTGASGVKPGDAVLQLRAAVQGGRNVRSSAFSLDYRIANPLGLAFQDENGNIVSSVGNTPDATAAVNQTNGNTATDQDPTGASGAQPVTSIRPSLTSPLGDPVGHGTQGVARALVIDRSLVSLIFGASRGLSNVRLDPGGTAWVIDGTSPTGGVIKPLTDNTGVVYPNFEDYPISVPNTSGDYPDIGRDRMNATKDSFGFAQNPVYSGVSLTPPVITATDRANYRTNDPVLGYDAQMVRTLAPTNFDLALDVPRYQPPSHLGYFGTHTVFVDSGRPGFDGASAEPYRTFGAGLAVAVDERLSVGTPTLDLGSLPEGGGFNGGAAFGPLQPWVPATLFSPWNTTYTTGLQKMFDSFQVRNDGNVNLLNVRVAKEFDRTGALGRIYRPVELFAPGLHELAWLDADLHLYSDLDPRFTATGLTGLDTEARNILQKARPGDVAPTTLSVNPRSRINPNLRGSGSFLMDTAVVPPGDPKIGVTAPIGTPVGDYIRKIYVFEDRLGTDRRPDIPSLGDDESFSDPALNLKFTVRESRLTSLPTTKDAPNMENIATGTEPFRYSSLSPSMFRDAQGNVFAAFVSDRVDVGNTPAWVPKPKTESDTAVVPTWRIYVSSLVFDGGSVPGDTQSPIGDFNGWAQANTSRWFNRAVATSFPTTAPASLFTLSPGDALVPGTVQFGAPSFPSSGAFDQTDFPSAVGRTGSSDRYMAFLGTATASDGAGNRRAIDQLMVANLHFAADGTITENAPAVGMPYDLGSNKSKPSLVQLGTHATVFYTTSSTGFGRVNFSSFDGTNWLTPRSLDMGNAFENVGQPSAVLRRWRNEDVPFIDLAFSAKIRGRAFAEAFLTRLEADANGVPLPDQPQRPFGPRIDPLELDPSTGDYWAPGAVWRLARNDLVVPDPTTPFDPTEEFIDIFRLVNGNYVSVLDKTTRSFDRETGVLTHNSTLGGKVYVDTKTGSVRFSGSLVPRSLRLYVRYAPTYLKVSTGPGANYQSASMVYDDRFIGVYENTADPIRNLLGDISYWGDQFSSRPPNDALLRWDRHVMTFTRTSGDGTQTTRPFMSAYRFGIQLPTPVAINPNGTLTSFTVQWIDNAGLPGSEQYFQVDPGTGRVFFMAGMEDRLVRIVYTGLDQNGNPIGPITYEAKVDPTVELREEAIAIEQPGNETGLSIALDPLSNLFNRQNFRRPPLYWLFWTSTRVGVPDVFFETIAPRFTPKPPN